MTSPVRAIPEGYHTVTPYLVVKGAAGAIDFYKQAYGATEVMRLDQPTCVAARGSRAPPSATHRNRWVMEACQTLLPEPTAGRVRL